MLEENNYFYMDWIILMVCNNPKYHQRRSTNCYISQIEAEDSKFIGIAPMNFNYLGDYECLDVNVVGSNLEESTS